MNATQEKAAISLANKDEVLIKLFFRLDESMPSGLEERPMETDRQHAEWAASSDKEELAKISRVREGRVDTGEHVIRNAKGVQIATLRRGLRNAGFGLSECYYYYKESTVENPRGRRFNTRTQYNVVVMRFERIRQGYSAPELPAATLSALREFANHVWEFAHGWDNPAIGEAPDNITINCLHTMGRRPDKDKPRNPNILERAIVVREGELHLIETEQKIEESEE